MWISILHFGLTNYYGVCYDGDIMQLNFFTPADLAAHLGLTQRRIQQLLKAGVVRGTHRGGRWVITPREAKRFIAAYQAQQKEEAGSLKH